jgi:hypothetical protein
VVSHAEREECLYGERQGVEIVVFVVDRSIYSRAWESQCSNRSKSTKSDSDVRGKTLEVLSFLPGHSLNRTWPRLIADCSEGRFQQVPAISTTGHLHVSRDSDGSRH